MNSQKPAKNRINNLLIVFVLANVIGDIVNVIAWLVVPGMRGSLTGGVIGGIQMSGGYIAQIAGVDAALIVGSVILTVVAVAYIVGLFGLMKGRIWGPLLVIVISIVNRLLALLLFAFNEAFAFWCVWTVILIVVATLDYRRLSVASGAKV